jgi:hypothetical protein
MRLNRKQKLAFGTALLLFLATGIYPPWLYTHVVVAENEVTEAGVGETGDHPAVATALATAKLERPWSYGWIFSPPLLTLAQIHHPKVDYEGGRIDLTRLLVEWGVLFVLTAGLLIILRDESVIS